MAHILGKFDKRDSLSFRRVIRVAYRPTWKDSHECTEVVLCVELLQRRPDGQGTCLKPKVLESTDL